MTHKAMLAALKIALGIEDDQQDPLLHLLLHRTLDKVLADINEKYLPARCASLVVEMAEDAYQLIAASRNESAGEITGSVSSVSDSGQSVSYRASDYAAITKAVAEAYLKDYAARLEPFRRPRW